MKDLYEILGLPRDADDAAIKRAYRARAKKAHPDHGGSTEQFGELALAYDVLRDQRRRQEYDRTGHVDPKAADNSHVAVLQLVTQALEDAIAKAMAMDSEAPLSKNILELAKSKLRRDQAEAQKIAREQKKNARLARRAAEKFSRNKGENQIAAIFINKAEKFEAAAGNAEGAVDLMRSGLALLADYSFAPDAPHSTPSAFYPIKPPFFGVDMGRGT